MSQIQHINGPLTCSTVAGVRVAKTEESIACSCRAAGLRNADAWVFGGVAYFRRETAQAAAEAARPDERADAMAALVSLGMKKTEAASRVARNYANGGRTLGELIRS